MSKRNLIILSTASLILAACQSTGAPPRAIPLGQTRVLDRLISINEDCTSTGEIVARLTQPPHNGSVQFKPTTDYPNFPKTNPRSACNRQKVAAIQVAYTPKPGFTGDDSFGIDIIFPNGVARQSIYPVNVR